MAEVAGLSTLAVSIEVHRHRLKGSRVKSARPRDFGGNFEVYCTFVPAPAPAPATQVEVGRHTRHPVVGTDGDTDTEKRS